MEQRYIEINEYLEERSEERDREERTLAQRLRELRVDIVNRAMRELDQAA